jgi:multicomponent Na+:H+ antiporter subunit D
MTLKELTGLDWQIAYTVIALLLMIAVEIYASRIYQGNHYSWVALVSTGLILAGIWIPSSIGKTLALDVAALLLAWFVWQQNKQAGILFGLAVVTGSVLVAAGMAVDGMFSGEALTSPEGPTLKIVTSLILIGFTLKLAVIPFSFWLAPLSEKSTPMTAVLVISLLDMAEFGELAILRAEAPWIFSNIQWIWIAFALLSMFGGALLALSQTNIRRMLAFSTIDDIGYLLLGLAAGTAGGVLGALIGALSHSLCKYLLFGAVGVAEKDLKHPLTLEDRGQSSRHPVAGAAFIAGALGMLGVPPLMGFLGRWRLYFAGIEVGGLVLGIAMALATALALVYYVRVIHRVWLGQAVNEIKKSSANNSLIDVIFILLIILMIVVCLFPAILPGIGGR